MPRASTVEHRIVNRKTEDAENPFARQQYVVSRANLANSPKRVYEAWEIADGRTFEFATTKYVDETPS